MALIKRMKLDDYIRATPSIRRRTWTLFSRTVTVVGIGLAVFTAAALIIETQAANGTIRAWSELVAAGADSEKELRSSLDDPSAAAVLSDPFFQGDDWMFFEVAVSVDDQRTLQSMKNQVVYDTGFMVWPHLRTQLIAWSDTLTLSIDSATRTDLYALKAFHSVCSADGVDLAPMFALGGDTLTAKVTEVVATHCAT